MLFPLEGPICDFDRLVQGLLTPAVYRTPQAQQLVFLPHYPSYKTYRDFCLGGMTGRHGEGFGL